MFIYFNAFKRFVGAYFLTEKELFLTFFICLTSKFMLFNFLWCKQTTFTPFSSVELYTNAFLCVLVLLMPFIINRAVKFTLFLSFLLDLLFISNLMYFRTYYTAIPLESYGLLGNLKDFTDSVWDAVRLPDLGFLMLTSIPWIVWWKKYRPSGGRSITYNKRAALLHTTVMVVFLFIFSAIPVIADNGYKAAYEKLKKSNKYSCTTPMYTVFGTLLYEYLEREEEYTVIKESEIESWLSSNNQCRQVAEVTSYPENLIIILAESFESWVLEKRIEGKEITPNLNAFLKESNTVYAPRVLSQVKGGRSIDGQLLVNTGLLPVASGAYSTQFADNYYPSLAKAFKEKHTDGKAYLVTVDKEYVWNQKGVAQAFGYDSLVSHASFIADERVGPRRKVSDVSFLRQCAEKIANGEIWNDDTPMLLQCITYSGHSPFILPDELKRISFSEKLPEVMEDYVTMANFTDYAIGNFIDSLKKQGRYEHTMIVITGDHEGLADYRDDLCKTKEGYGVVSAEQFVPLIILNAPVGMRYENVMGQVDIYPTMLSLMGLQQYEWQGIGHTILDGNKKQFAIDPRMNIIGDTAESLSEEIEFAKNAWHISDQLIRYDYFGRRN